MKKLSIWNFSQFISSDDKEKQEDIKFRDFLYVL